jgi:hypothetical protein
LFEPKIMFILSVLSFIIPTSNTKWKFRYLYLLQSMQNEAAATSHIWCILLDLLLSQHASLNWVSAHFTKVTENVLFPSSQIQMIDFIALG